MPIPLASAPRQASIACIGKVGEVGAVKEVSEGRYLMIPISLVPTEGGRRIRVNFMFRPEWFGQDFRPDHDIEEQWGEDARSVLFVYRKNFGVKGNLGILPGLVGATEDAGNALFDIISEALVGASDDEVGSIVEKALRENVTSEDDGMENTVGYIIQQRSRSVKDDQGKWETIYEDQMEVGDGRKSGFWTVNEKGKADMERRAARTKSGLFKVSWETGE